MRLVCPNCDAQYEVDDTAIPEAGRDVQCSNCGHAWFQQHPVADAPPSEAVAAAEDDDAFGEPMMDLTGEPVPVPDALPAVITPPPPLQRKALDESVLAVLREEAEREVAVRKAEAPQVVQVQTDMGLQAPPLTPPVSPSVIAARERFRDLSADPEELAAEEAATRPASRRELLPDIEEINSTLRASDVPRGAGEAALPVVVVDRRRGFRSGFVLMIVLSAGLWIIYAMSPRIVAGIPASEPAMQAYVAAVNQARVGVDAALQSASRSLRSLSGKDG